jgi:ankyrin repeat protein
MKNITIRTMKSATKRIFLMILVVSMTFPFSGCAKFSHGSADSAQAAEFFKTLEDGDTAKTKAMVLKEPGLVKAIDEGGNNALIYTVRYGHQELTELLIARGANVNAKGRKDWTPLMVAAGRGDNAMVKSLISRGADVNARNTYGTTPMIMAAASGDCETAKLLIKKGADMETKDLNGDSPLSVAIKEGNGEVASLLRSHGAKERKSKPEPSKTESRESHGEH